MALLVMSVLVKTVVGHNVVLHVKVVKMGQLVFVRRVILLKMPREIVRLVRLPLHGSLWPKVGIVRMFVQGLLTHLTAMGAIVVAPAIIPVGTGYSVWLVQGTPHIGTGHSVRRALMKPPIGMGHSV